MKSCLLILILDLTFPLIFFCRFVYFRHAIRYLRARHHQAKENNPTSLRAKHVDFHSHRMPNRRPADADRNLAYIFADRFRPPRAT